MREGEGKEKQKDSLIILHSSLITIYNESVITTEKKNTMKSMS